MSLSKAKLFHLFRANDLLKGDDDQEENHVKFFIPALDMTLNSLIEGLVQFLSLLST